MRRLLSNTTMERINVLMGLLMSGPSFPTVPIFDRLQGAVCFDEDSLDELDGRSLVTKHFLPFPSLTSLSLIRGDARPHWPQC